MKKILYYILPLLIAAAVIVPFACTKTEKGRTDDLPALQPDKTDIDAGGWKPILLASANEFSVSAPIATNTPDYIAQLSEIKSWQASITENEKNIVKYWSAGAVLRWNEILRELVAKHNLPPYQNDDGTYPIPNANNPLAYPQFPFANPPYAARAYAYVSAAQYDALVAAYYYKKLYNRPAPYKVDATINVLVPQSDLPSYPSEDAVVEGAAVEMMKLLFPGDQQYIQQKAEEHKHARIISGANVRSDIEAGEALGKAVAQKFATRARGDRAGAAVGTPADWAKLETDCIARGETPWYSLENPKRPPMLPLFGKVKAFLFDSLTAISLRPGPPPLTASKKMSDETDEILSLTKNDTRDHYRIVHYWADGAGTSTPSGHWDAIAAEDFIKKNYSEVRWARNMALLNMSLMDAAIVCWDTKYFYFNPRPCQMNPAIKTLTGVPNFPAYVSGHSTFSGAASTVLSYIIPDRATAYDDLAREASLSRMLAGIHFRADCEVGLETGKKVGNYAVDRGKADGAGN
ncbi:PA-phosphatase [Niastella koreensis]|uniref:Phosphoesterase PA-phosphatase related protein n=2 Tax=Niastella koreensis TaxID=354356 RepID=G8TJY0_NIAKG|nr:phosphatase PAP2 family protein [Niastella koreensis]AEW02918.1 phosphoesterase PA-phosphatase related protein [Niastella koreensis GR20-10]OQP55240.1 PA-phosphatase [Niastella koreensis]